MTTKVTGCSKCHRSDVEFYDNGYRYCKPCSREMSRNNHHKRRVENPIYYRNAKLVELYGITAEEYAEMLLEQNGVCAICGEPETQIDARTGRVIQLAVDHNKDTGKVRGLLCSNDNRAIGLMNHEPQRLREAADYLERTDG